MMIDGHFLAFLLLDKTSSNGNFYISLFQSLFSSNFWISEYQKLSALKVEKYFDCQNNFKSPR
jgi:hypothetical protein